MPSYPYLGTETRVYPRYLDEGTGKTLVAAPAGAYSMTPVAACPELPVPPNDGLWGEPEYAAETPRDDAAKPAKTPARTVKTAAAAAAEERADG